MSRITDGVIRSSAVRGLRAHVQRLAERRIVRQAVDVTFTTSDRSALVFAPHPDDEALGCGSTMMRKREAGTRVAVVVATDGRTSHRSEVVTAEELGAIRIAESIDACRTMGLSESELEFLGHATLRAATGLDEQVERAITRFAPDEVFVTSGLDRHPDHVALNIAVRRSPAVERVGCRVLEYPIWFWRVFPWTTKPRGLPDAAWRFIADPVRTLSSLHPEIVHTGGYLSRKREVLSAYRSQMTNLTGEASWQTFDPDYLQHFLKPFEMFFPVPQ